MLFHIKCPECGSLTVKTTTADVDFDKAFAKLLGATPDTEPNSSKDDVELFCLNGHKLALEEIGRQIVEQCEAIEARSLRRAQSPAPPTYVTSPSAAFRANANLAVIRSDLNRTKIQAAEDRLGQGSTSQSKQSKKITLKIRTLLNRCFTLDAYRKKTDDESYPR